MEVTTYDSTQCLAEIEDRESKRKLMSGEKNPAITFMKDVKNSLLFKYDWAEILSAAPLSLSLMGYCYLAASSAKSTISLDDAAPKDGFKYLRYPTLKASLIQVSDTGRMAFINSESKMSMVSATSASLSQLMNQIVECIGNLPHPAAARSLQSKLSLLKSGCDNCSQYTKDTESAFTNWLELVMELHQVSVYKDELTDKKQVRNIVKIAQEELSYDLTKETERRAEEAAVLMKRQLESANSAFKNAATNCPGPWASLVIGTVDSYHRTITTGMSQVVNAMTQPRQSRRECGGRHGSGFESTLKGSEGNVDFNDPAFAIAGQVSNLMTGLTALLTNGIGGGVDWDLTATTGESGLTFLLGNLTHLQRHGTFTKGEASTTLKYVIERAVKILNGIKEIAEKPTQISSDKPAADSPEVQKWRAKVKKIKGMVLSLESTAASFPGNSTNMSAKSTRPPQNLNPAAANTILANVTERLKIMESAYLNTQKSYDQANQRLYGIQAELGQIQKELKKLHIERATLADVKKILVQCMGVLSDLKGNITDLVRFFKAISTMVEYVIEMHVTNFVDEANNAKDHMMTAGTTSFADFQRKNIYSACLMVRAYFSIIQNIANMYTQVSRDYVMPGLRMCDELSKASIGEQPQSVIIEKNRVLEEYAADVNEKLRQMVKEKQDKVSGQLQERAETIAAEITYIPAGLVIQSQAAIEEGGKNAALSTAQAIEDNGSLAVEAGRMEFTSDFGDFD